ncbi:hypothetical protein LBMAG56_04780 [Verrucomicrobiota bacterium]|nr:hypothetical protein LBMAG56_04780 [Verrucomicrobiota bacterium]
MTSILSPGYRIVKLASGARSIQDLDCGETFHPVIGPVAEAKALYVEQMRLPDRLRVATGEFVIWDVGLGAAANPLTILAATRAIPGKIRIISFEKTLEPLRFAVEHGEELGYFAGYESTVAGLLQDGAADFTNGFQTVKWEVHLGDFPTLLRNAVAELPLRSFPAPHAILFDAYSPARNPAMWTLPLFHDLFQMLKPDRPCAMPTYSRSTMLRVTLLLAGFYVGAGHATGEKEETTIAANTLALIDQPLDCKWLARTERSTSAEPMVEAVYRQAPISPKTRELLSVHPQFR